MGASIAAPAQPARANLWGIRNRSVAEQQFQILGIRSFSGFRDGGVLSFEVHLGKLLIHGAGG